MPPPITTTSQVSSCVRGGCTLNRPSRLGQNGRLYVTLTGTTTDADRLRCALERVVPARFSISVMT